MSAWKVGDHDANIVRGIFVQQVEHKIIIPIGYALGCPRFPRHAIAIQANEYASLCAILGLVKIFYYVGLFDLKTIVRAKTPVVVALGHFRERVIVQTEWSLSLGVEALFSIE